MSSEHIIPGRPNDHEKAADDPKPDSLYEAYEIELQSSAGGSIRFGDLIAGKGSNITTLVIFSADSLLASLPDPGSGGPCQVIIIGCGDPARIIPYVAETAARFPVYTDPTGRIYSELRMNRSVRGITRPPAYTEVSFVRALGRTLRQMFSAGGWRRAFRGGPWNLNGGEWVFKGGRCVYVHRMESVGDHLTAGQLLEALGEGE
ncbi:peroxiredoxin-like family protein, partial [Aspergillus brunneoviolaceus CBS 621.78]